MSENKNDNDDLAAAAKHILETLLDLMGVSASIAPSAGLLAEGESGAITGITLDVSGEDLGILIGRRGQTLSCLQYIVRLITGNQKKVWTPITIDVEGYKQRRYNALQALAWRIAEQVKASGMPFALEPMPNFDRRIIHLTLGDYSDVTTQSSGEGESRKVVVLLKEQL